MSYVEIENPNANRSHNPHPHLDAELRFGSSIYIWIGEYNLGLDAAVDSGLDLRISFVIAILDSESDSDLVPLVVVESDSRFRTGFRLEMDSRF